MRADRRADPPQSPDRYGSVDKLLHWLVFALVLIQFVIAFTMPAIHRGVVPGTMINLHLSFGALILAVAVARIAWRLGHPVAPMAGVSPAWLPLAARAVHVSLYVLLLALPLLGWAAASARGWTVRVFDLVTLPQLLPTDAKPGFVAGDVHVALSWLLLALIALHTAAAVYHRFVLRDRVLQRMLSRDR